MRQSTTVLLMEGLGLYVLNELIPKIQMHSFFRDNWLKSKIYGTHISDPNINVYIFFINSSTVQQCIVEIYVGYHL